MAYAYRKILDKLKRLQTIPNPPFLLTPRVKHLVKLFKKAGINYSFVKVKGVKVALKVSFIKNQSHPTVYFLSHLDHPGLMKLNGKWQGLGSLYVEYLKNKQLPVTLYPNTGNNLGTGEFVPVTSDGAFLKPLSTVPQEALWGLVNVTPYQDAADKVYARSHDNDLPTAILLELLFNINSFLNQKLNAVFVFTFFEEVFQISANAIARFNVLNIRPKDMIVVVEAMRVLEDIDDVYFPKAYSKHLNYTNGPIISLSEKNIVYALDFKENLLFKALYKAFKGVRFQHGFATGSTEAWPFAFYGLTQNIVTVNIPNAHKHNVNKQTGLLVPEEVYKKDIESTFVGLSRLLSFDLSKIKMPANLKQTYNDYKKRYKQITDAVKIKNKACVSTRLFYAYSSVIKRNSNKITLFNKLVSYYNYLLCKLVGSNKFIRNS